jgi:Superinfection immunity protein
MFALVAFLCGVAMYFMPAIVAHHRQHVSSGKIFLINLLLGWSVIGWVVCFAWACSGNTRQQIMILPPVRR